VLVAAACCPHPPLLVPQVAQGTAAGLDALRAACDAAVADLLASHPDSVLVLGSAPRAGRWPQGAAGSLRPYGVDLQAGGTGGDGLPLSLTVGAWLLDRAGWVGRRAYVATSGGAGEPEPVAENVDDPGERLAVLCMADGSAMRFAGAPGHLDERAETFDGGVAAALRDGDAAALAALDLDLGAQLWAGGVPAWRELGRRLSTHGRPCARLLHDAAPYGVGYLVASWRWD